MIKISISEKIITIDHKIEQNKAQYDSDKKTAKISALSSENVFKYEFLIGNDVLTEKAFLEKAAAIKRFEYSPLRSELKKETSITKKQYPGLNRFFESNKKEEPVTINKEGPTMTDKLKPVYGRKFYDKIR